jgi:hypothetical protein
MIAMRAHQTVFHAQPVATVGVDGEMLVIPANTTAQQGYLWKTIASDDVGLDFMAKLESEGWETCVSSGYGYTNLYAAKVFQVSDTISVEIRVFAWPDVDHLDEIETMMPRIPFPPPA